MRDHLPAGGECDETRSAAVADHFWAPHSWVVLAASLAFTLVVAFPVLQAPSQRLFGHEIVGRAHDPFTAISIFEHPGRPTIYTQPATDYLGAVLSRLVGGVAAYNAVVLLSFPLAALFAYFLVAHLTRSLPAAAIASALYAFSPFHLAHAAYHPHVAQTQWLPLYLLALWRALESDSRRRLLVVAASFGLVTLSNFYFGFIALVLTPFVVVARQTSLGSRSGTPRWRPPLRIFLLFGSMAALGVLYLGRIAPRFLANPASAGFPPHDLELYTARWRSYLLPAVDHAWLGSRVERFWRAHALQSGMVEQQVTVGFGVTVLAALAIVAFWRQRRSAGIAESPTLEAVPVLAMLAVVATAISLQPAWHFASFAVSGPSRLLFAVAPMFRALARFGVVVDLALTALAGLGLVLLWRRPTRGPRFAAAALLALVLVERSPLPPWRWRDVLPTEAHRLLKDERPAGRILDCVPASDPAQRSVPRLFGRGLVLLGEGSDCGETKIAGKLAARGFTRMIVRRPSRLDDWLEIHPAASGLRALQSFDDSRLYAVDAAAPPAVVDLAGPFYDREYRPKGSFRWMGDRAALIVESNVDRPQRFRLALTLHAFAMPRRLRVATAAGNPIASLDVGLAPRSIELGELDLASHSRVELWLLADPPATVADELLHNGDLRAVSVALWDWSIKPASGTPGDYGKDRGEAPTADR